MVDLTTLEGADTHGKVRSLCAKAMRPDPSDPSAPAGRRRLRLPRPRRDRGRGAARQRRARRERRDGVPVGARVARDQARRRARRRRGRRRRDRHGDRPRRLPGGPLRRRSSTRSSPTRAACGSAHLKVILETGELATLDNVRRASVLALLAGGDFIKTSTGKVSPAATPPVALVMLQAVRDFADATGERARRQARGRHPHEQGGDPLPRDGLRGRRPALARSPTSSASAPRACSTTCCCSATSSRAAPTTAPTT